MVQSIKNSIISFFLIIKEEIGQMKGSYFLRRPVFPALLITGIAICVLHQTGFFNRLKPQSVLHLAGERVLLTGVVCQPPDSRPKWMVYVVQVETLRRLGRKTPPISRRGRVLVYVAKTPEEWAQPGDRIQLFGVLQTPPTARVPGAFDYRSFLRHRGIEGIMYTSATAGHQLGPTDQYQFFRWGWRLKQLFLRIIQRHLNSDQTTVLAGLVVGERPRHHPEIRDIFLRSGTMHILVASGSNVAFVIGFWFLLARFLFRFSRRVCLATSLPFVWIYVAVVGADAPILRAGFMATIGLLAYLAEREDNGLHALAWAGLLQLLWDPLSLFDIGFQMSFVTVTGLILTMGSLGTKMSSERFWLHMIKRIFMATWIAQLWVFPISINTFLKYYPIGIFSNMMLIPLSAGGWLAGLALGITEMPLVAWLTRIYLDVIIGTTSFFARLGGDGWWMAPFPAYWTLGYYVCLVTVLGCRRFYWCRLLLIIGILLVIFPLFHQTPTPPEKTEITALDLGRYDATLIRFPDGTTQMETDARALNESTLNRLLLPYLVSKRLRRIDRLYLQKPERLSSEGLALFKKVIDVKELTEATEKRFNVSGGTTR